MIFNTGDFYENLSISSKIGYNRTTNSGILHEEVHTVGSSIKYFVARKIANVTICYLSVAAWTFHIVGSYMCQQQYK